MEMVLCIVGESVSKTSPHCSLSPRWLFSNVNGWLTVREHREGRWGGRYSLTMGEQLFALTENLTQEQSWAKGQEITDTHGLQKLHVTVQTSEQAQNNECF